MAKYWKQFTRFFKIYFDIAMSHVQRTEGQQRQALHVWPVRLRLVNQPGARGIRDNYYGSAGDCAADSSCVCESINCFLPRGENKGTVKKCTGDSLNPRNTCFKTVNKKTGGLTLKWYFAESLVNVIVLRETVKNVWYPPIPLRKKSFFFSHWLSVKGRGGVPPNSVEEKIR